MKGLKERTPLAGSDAQGGWREAKFSGRKEKNYCTMCATLIPRVLDMSCGKD
jgi:hypothetical protein